MSEPCSHYLQCFVHSWSSFFKKECLVYIQVFFKLYFTCYSYNWYFLQEIGTHQADLSYKYTLCIIHFLIVFLTSKFRLRSWEWEDWESICTTVTHVCPTLHQKRYSLLGSGSLWLYFLWYMTIHATYISDIVGEREREWVCLCVYAQLCLYFWLWVLWMQRSCCISQGSTEKQNK